ncbi:MAG: CstA-like transporter-associated (seleno)protein [Steroidobacteraceae bacterium]
MLPTAHRVRAAARRGSVELLAGLARTSRALRQMFGVPDYERYVAHKQAKHPGSPLLAEPLYHAVAIHRRYGGSRPKCC